MRGRRNYNQSTSGSVFYSVPPEVPGGSAERGWLKVPPVPVSLGVEVSPKGDSLIRGVVAEDMLESGVFWRLPFLPWRGDCGEEALAPDMRPPMLARRGEETVRMGRAGFGESGVPEESVNPRCRVAGSGGTAVLVEDCCELLVEAEI